jgi:uncharacterized protein
MKVPGITEAIYRQAAGFLRIPDGEEPLDATWLHPEQYDLARRLLERLGFTAEALKDPFRRRQLRAALSQADTRQLAQQLECSAVLLREVMNHLAAAGRDPRLAYPPPILRQRMIPVEELQPGQMLQGLVLRVTDFGAFVDIGAEETGLLHRSRLGQSKFHSPREVVGVGEVRNVWVVQVDKVNRRIGLSFLPPIARRRRRVARRRRPVVATVRETPPVIMQVQPPTPVVAASSPTVESKAAAPSVPASEVVPASVETPSPAASGVVPTPVEPAPVASAPSPAQPKSAAAEAKPEVTEQLPASSRPPAGSRPEKPTSVRPTRELARPPEVPPEVLLSKRELRTFAELKALFEARQRLQASGESATATPSPNESSAASSSPAASGES